MDSVWFGKYVQVFATILTNSFILKIDIKFVSTMTCPFFEYWILQPMHVLGLENTMPGIDLGRFVRLRTCIVLYSTTAE